MSKVVFITGGTTGIGRSIACTLAKDGFDVCINCRKCYFARGDVSNYDDAERMIKDIIEKFEKIDVLVNNAGITKDNLLMRMKKEDFEDVINVNLVGTFNITKCAVPYMMKKRSGRIINMSSVVRNFWKCRAS